MSQGSADSCLRSMPRFEPEASHMVIDCQGPGILEFWCQMPGVFDLHGLLAWPDLQGACRAAGLLARTWFSSEEEDRRHGPSPSDILESLQNYKKGKFVP